MSSSRSILVLAAGSLGDSILTLPALRALKARAPVTVAGTSPYLALGADLFGVDRVVPLEPLLQSLYSGRKEDPALVSALDGIGEVVVLFKERDPRLLEGIGSFGAVQVRFPAGSFEDFLREGRWAGDYWLEAVLQVPAPSDNPWREQKLNLSAERADRGREILGALGLEKPLVLHPGSGSPSKNAPLDFFRKAAEDAATGAGKGVLVVWGEAEADQIASIREGFQRIPGVAVLKEPLALRDLAAVLSQCAAYLGNDSGPTHLAAACGARTFAVFHSTDPGIWGPRGAVILAAMKGFDR